MSAPPPSRVIALSHPIGTAGMERAHRFREARPGS
jgi:hypothetical protein